MLLFNGDVKIEKENEEWVVYSVKAMDYYYYIKLPIHLKKKAMSNKKEFNDALVQNNLKFKDLVIDVRKNKGKVYELQHKGGFQYYIRGGNPP